MRGRLALGTSAAYEDMRDTPLAGRQLRIDRKARNATTWTIGVYRPTATGASGDNWTQAIASSTAGQFDYRARWFTAAGEPALNTSNEITWSVTWATIACPSSVRL